jgi:hypothetical protein
MSLRARLGILFFPIFIWQTFIEHLFCFPFFGTKINAESETHACTGPYRPMDEQVKRLPEIKLTSHARKGTNPVKGRRIPGETTSEKIAEQGFQGLEPWNTRN